MKDILIKKFFYKLLVPTMLINLVSSVGALSDSVIVGNLIGPKALVALMFNAPLFMIINTIASLLAIGGLNVAGRLLGEGDGKASARFFSLSFSVGLVFGVIFAAIGAMFMDDISYLLGARAELIPLTSQYGRVILFGSIIFLSNTVLGFFIRLEGRAQLVMSAILVSIFLNIALAYIFIKFFNYGIMGAALALVVSQIVSIAIMLSHFFTKGCTIALRLYFNIRDLFLVIRSGAGTSSAFIYRSVALLMLNNIIFSVAGQKGMEVYVALYLISLIAMTMFEGVSQTMQPFVSTYFGEGNAYNIKTTMKICFKTGLSMSAFVVLLIFIFAKKIAMMYGISNADTIAAAAFAIRVYTPAIFVMITNIILSYYYQSIARENITLFIVPLRELVLLVPSILILGTIFSLNGLWFGYIVAESLTLAIGLLLAKVTGKQRKSLPGILIEGYYGSALLEELNDYREAKTLAQNVIAQNKNLLGDKNIIQIFLNKGSMYFSSDAPGFVCDLPDAQSCGAIGIRRYKVGGFCCIDY